MRMLKDWAEADRPREKMQERGAASLSDSELLAILLGSGTRDLNAVELSKLLLASAGNNLLSLSKMNFQELTAIRGIGQAKALHLLAAFEIGRRRREAEAREQQKITTSREAFLYVEPRLCDLHHEEFWVLFLNRANKVISMKQVSEGGWSGTVADPKVIFKAALDEKASYLILAHNHPSGNLQPSAQDMQLTKQMAEAGRVLEIRVLDHIIVAANSYYSFADEGHIT